MRQMDKLMVWGAWALMVAVGSLSAWKISRTPKVDPEIVKLTNDLRDLQESRIVRHPAPPLPKGPIIVWPPPAPEAARPTEWAGSIQSAYIGVPYDRKSEDVFILTLAKISSEPKANLDGVTIGWELFRPTVALEKPWMIRKESSPEKFSILRQCEDGIVEKIAELGPKERSYTDLSTEPRFTYRYWVAVTGKETVLSDLSKNPLETKVVTKELPGSAEARTPSVTRVKLVGGDASIALLKVEIYDRAQKKWILKIVQAAAGRGIGKSGWTLNRLRLDGFYLVADVTDDEGVDHVLSTKD